MAESNASILAAAWLAGTNTYQQSVPKVSQVGVRQVQEFLFAPMNRMYLNQFTNFLIQRLAGHYIRQKEFNNPLAWLKNEQLNYGQTVQETAFKWLRGHSYNSDDMATSTILKTHYPEGSSAYHSVNRRDRYAISFTQYQLREAFESEYGLNDFISAVTQTARNRAELDEFAIMKNLLAEFHNEHGMFSVHVDEPTNEDSARALLRKLREYADRLRFPNTLYNALDVCDIPVFVDDPSDLVLFIEPATRSFIDVEALAPLFNVELADIPYRVQVVDEIPIPNTVAVLAPRDFWMVNDTLNETAEFFNPESLTTTYFVHRWGIYSVSPFVPVIRFTTDEDTKVPTITQTVTGLEIKAPETIFLNDKVSKPQLVANLLGTINGEEGCCMNDIGVRPDTAIFNVTSVKDGDGNELAWTEDQVLIYPNGEIYVQARGNSKLARAVREGGVTLEIEGIATYINPTGATQEHTATATVKVECKDED